MGVSKALLNDISSEDNIPFYDKFVEDVAKLESANGVLSPNSELRNDIVTFISENYTPREAGHMVRYAQHVSLRLQTFCPSASDATVRW